MLVEVDEVELEVEDVETEVLDVDTEVLEVEVVIVVVDVELEVEDVLVVVEYSETSLTLEPSDQLSNAYAMTSMVLPAGVVAGVTVLASIVSALAVTVGCP